MIALADVPAPSEIWPVSVAGWLALGLSAVAIAAVLIRLGRDKQRFEDTNRQLEDIAAKVGKINDTMTGLDHAFWGPDKKNGLYSKVRDVLKRIEDLERDGFAREAVEEERRRGAERAGKEERAETRRREDRIARGEEPL